MYDEITSEGSAPIKMWTRGVPVEDAARKQLENIARLPIVHSHVAVMPDVHYGIGATVGSVIPTKGAIIPAAVGVDLGCGMDAVRLSMSASDLPDSLRAVRAAIEAAVPVGFSCFDDAPRWQGEKWAADLQGGYERIIGKRPEITPSRHPANQLGTLGGGNHFIELCLDEADRVWVMLHSGSRGIGNRIGTHFIALAKREMERHQLQLPDRDLAYLNEGCEHFDDYVEAVDWAQRYAFANRLAMMLMTLEALRASGLRAFSPEYTAVSCHHNYVSREHHAGADVWLTRKGAVSAREGELGIIPGSMGARSFIVRGKSNPDSFCSCSHGAGRAMSRGEARRRFTIEDHVLATAGVECLKDVSVLDETPGAYKSIDAVMTAQSDLVDVVHVLKQVLCVKG